MSQNLVTLKLSADDHAAIDAALATIEAVLPGLSDHTPSARHRSTDAEERAAVSCRQTLALLARNPRMRPSGFDMAQAHDGLRQLEQWRQRAQRLRTLLDHLDDAIVALGNEVTRASMGPGALREITGKGAALGAFRQGVVTHVGEVHRAANEAPRLRPVPAPVDAG